MAKAKAKKAPDTSFDDFDAMVDGIIEDADRATDLTSELVWISAGNIALNLALSGNPAYGIPLGRIVNLEGESDTGKTLIAQTLMREAQQQFQHKFRGLYIDVERGLELSRLEGMGMFTKRKPKDANNPKPENNEDTNGDQRAGTFRTVRTTDLTQIAEKVLPPFIDAVRNNPDYCGILCIDSVTMLMTDHERETDFGTRDMARAQEIRKLMRQLNDAFCDNLMILLVHHQSDVIRTNPYEKINDSRDMKKTISGGKSVKYVPDIRIEVAYGGQETRGSDSKKRVIGQTARVHVKKTRLFRPMISAEPTIDHSYGFTRTGGLFDQMKQLGLIQANGKMWQCPEIIGTDKKFFTDQMKDEIEKEENARKVIDAILSRLQMAAYTEGDGEAPPQDSAQADAFDGLD